MSEELPVLDREERPHPPSGALYLLLDGLTALSLIGGTSYFFLHFDPLTLAALVLVGVIWTAYTAAAHFRSPPTVPFQGALEREAQQRLVRIDNASYLPAGASSAILSELSEQERWSLPGWLSTGQGFLVSIGLVGTFLGLTLGLLDAVDNLLAQDSEVVQQGMGALLGGAKLAFVKSIAGVGCGMIWSLRYRRLEVLHGYWLDEQRLWLEEQYKTISDQALTVKIAEQHQSTMLSLAEQQHRDHQQLSDELKRSLLNLDQRAQARQQKLDHLLMEIETTLKRALSADEDARKAAADIQLDLGQRISRSIGDAREVLATRLKESTTAVCHGIDELRQLVESVSDSLPEDIGNKTQGLLTPSLDQISTVLRELASAGGQAIGDTINESMGNEITGLQRSLADLAQRLQDLGPKTEARIQEGAASAASALSEAGQRTSQEMRAAAAELSTGVGEMKAMAESIRSALGETKEIAERLRGAGTEVGDGLRAASEPLLRLPLALDSARSAMVDVQQGFDRGATAATAHTTRIEQLNELMERTIENNHNAIAEAQTLAEQVERLRAACAATADAFQATAAGQEQASSKAAAQLVETVAQFQHTMEETQRAVSAASQSTFEGAQNVTLHAAKQVADALSAGAATIEGSLKRLAEYSETMDRSLESAKRTAESIEGHANKLQTGVVAIHQPLMSAATVLGQVGSEVRDATVAIRAERDSLGTLGRELSGQAGAIRISHESLALRINEYKALQQLLSNEWAAHVRGIEGLLVKIKASWVDAAQAADSGLQKNSEQIAKYAQDVEKSLRLPNDLRKLDATLGELTNVLDDLSRAVARP